jgi:hypothetical protein
MLSSKWEVPTRIFNLVEQKLFGRAIAQEFQSRYMVDDSFLQL